MFGRSDLYSTQDGGATWTLDDNKTSPFNGVNREVPFRAFLFGQNQAFVGTGDDEPRGIVPRSIYRLSP